MPRIKLGYGILGAPVSGVAYCAQAPGLTALLRNLPNILTLLRILLVPVVILSLREGQYVSALVLFLLAGITDGLDGWIAKRFDCVSQLGTILDPVADKLLISSTFVMLVLLGDIPFWLVLMVVCRDVGIVGGYVILQLLGDVTAIQPTLLSKINTVLQIVLVRGVLLVHGVWAGGAVLVDVLIIAVTITTVASGLHYIYNGVIRAEPTA